MWWRVELTLASERRQFLRFPPRDAIAIVLTIAGPSKTRSVDRSHLPARWTRRPSGDGAFWK